MTICEEKVQLGLWVIEVIELEGKLMNTLMLRQGGMFGQASPFQTEEDEKNGLRHSHRILLLPSIRHPSFHGGNKIRHPTRYPLGKIRIHGKWPPGNLGLQHHRCSTITVPLATTGLLPVKPRITPSMHNRNQPKSNLLHPRFSLHQFTLHLQQPLFFPLQPLLFHHFTTRIHPLLRYCVPESSISMKIHAQFFNIDPNGYRNYLSVGQTNLPYLFFLFSGLYFVFLFFWLCHVNKRSFRRIHLLMALLLLTKAFNLFSAAMFKRFVNFTGTPHGWDVIFYVFQFIRVVLFFVVAVLVVTGWKKVLVIVIPLLVAANVAYVVVCETGPFIKDWVVWNQIFLLLNFLSGVVVVLLIIWSIVSLRKTSMAEGNN
ncbi:hypothetical protein RJT34_24471 [Clitoria ternatea]|uniref:Uncharacterized protein n=1 Tax=Clitoria ternatea TaxID=43366 RepID=A0AAN9FN37_CLITE